MKTKYRFHLKDAKKEQLLTALCKNQNAFLDALQPVAEKLARRDFDLQIVVFGDQPNIKEYSATISYEDIVEISQYDPKKWNNFLNVVPPEYTPLRLEMIHRINRDYGYDLKKTCYCVIWDGRHFFIPDTNLPALKIDEIELANGSLKVQFKGWDD